MWIELHDTLPDHPKIVELSMRIKIDRDAAVGKIVRLWLWVLNNREDGVIKAIDTPLLPEVMRLPKAKPDGLVHVLTETGLIDRLTDGSYKVHDWDEHVVMLLAKREEKRAQTRARVARYRDSVKSKKEDKCNAEKEECNALHERYNGVSTALSNAATVPNLTIEERKEATTTVCSQGDIYYNNTARAREETELSTTCGNLVDKPVENSDEELLEEFRDFYRRDAEPWEVPILRDMLTDYAPELVWKALGEAALRGAKKPVLYARESLSEWWSHGIEDLSDLAQWREDNGYD